MATKTALSLDGLLARKGELETLTEENDSLLSKALASAGKGKIHMVNGLPYRASSRKGGALYLRCMVPAEAQAAIAGKAQPTQEKKAKK